LKSCSKRSIKKSICPISHFERCAENSRIRNDRRHLRPVGCRVEEEKSIQYPF
jgi:hypothetical protein